MHSLNRDQIISTLDRILEVEFSFRDTHPAAEQISHIELDIQHYVLDWVERIASTNIELAFQFANHAPEMLNTTDQSTIEAWALHSMDIFDRKGLYKALEVMQESDEFMQRSHERAVGAVLDDQLSVLLPFVQGLSGRKLKLEEGEVTYTDSETIFLPAVLTQLPDAKNNFLLYKVLIAFLWAQNRFGTFRLDLCPILETHEHAEEFLQLFHTFETERLTACLQRELPGIYRDCQSLHHLIDDIDSHSNWNNYAAPLLSAEASVKTSLELTFTHFGKITLHSPFCYQGILNPDAVANTMQARIEKEKAQLRVALRQILDDTNKNKPNEKEEHDDSNEEQPIPDTALKNITAKELPDENQPDGIRVELTLDDQPIAPPDTVKSLLTSIVQDLGEIPDEYLVPAGDGEYDPKLFLDQHKDPDEVWSGTYHEEGAFLYKEWDYRRQHYRKNWCAVREMTVKPIYDTFVDDTIHKYKGLIKHLRKTFEALRDEDRMLKRQAQGDGIDIDAWVEAMADAKDGSEMSDRLFTRMHRTERNIAVVFMVDMSGSTKGWINEAERESLVLLCESLETLGDRYAIYGFSGMTRKRCELYVIKEFTEPYNEEVKARISGIQPKDYTRMGFAVRHLSKLLNEIEAKTRILITISDGKPDDYDNYRGEYGVEDTRRALMEARQDGIHSYCITIDKEAREYLAHMYGAAAYTVIEEVNQLPLKVSNIYRRLTT
jgi:nitric oxide reductase NorD protein